MLRLVPKIFALRHLSRLPGVVLTASIILGLQLATIPVELFEGSSCKMACSLSERGCCCRGPNWSGDDDHVGLSLPEIGSHGRPCPPAAATAGSSDLPAPTLARASRLAARLPTATRVEFADRHGAISTGLLIPLRPRPPPARSVRS